MARGAAQRQQQDDPTFDEPALDASGSGDGTIEDALRSAFEEIGDDVSLDPAPEPAEPAVEAPEGGEPAKAAEPAPEDEEGTDAPAEGEEPGEEAKAADEPSDTVLEPPQDWSAEDHEIFHQQSDDVKRFLLDKAASFQRDYTRKTEEIARERQRYAALEEVLGPRRREIEAMGLDEARAIKGLLAIRDWADQSPVEYIRHFAQQKGIDLKGMVGASEPPPAGGADEYDDPALAPLKQEIAGLKQQLQQATSGIQTFQQTAEQQRVAQHEAQVREFAEAKDERGAPRHPHFEEVKGLMAGLLQQRHAADLETAYAMATRAHPEVSRKLAVAEQAAKEREQQRRRREHAEQARRAGSSITGTPAGSTPRPPKDDPYDELAAVADELGVRFS